MRKVVLSFLLCFFTINSYSQIFNIIEKSSLGTEERCSGTILQSAITKSIYIELSDMLNERFTILRKEQIDERTINYICKKSNSEPEFTKYGLKFKEYSIIKQKCNINPNVYFFEFPPLYDGQFRTIYKTKKTE